MKAWPEAPIYTLLYDEAVMGADFAGRDIRTSYLQKFPGTTRHYKALLPLIDGAFRRFNLDDYDIVLSSASGWAKSVRTGPQTTHLCYCHTPIRYLWSDSDRYISELPYPAPVKRLIKLWRPRLRRADLRAAREVDQFLANSQHIAGRIKKYYGRDSQIIHPPVDIDQFAPSDARGDYFLVATRLEPYKRVDLAIAACAEAGLPLKIMGSGTDERRLRGLAGPAVEFTGRVSDQARGRLFAEARALLNPQEEDFGITAVEALASGTPVIAYAVGGAREILEDGRHGVLFTEQSVPALLRAIQEFQDRRFDPAALRRRATDFSEDTFVAAIRGAVAKAGQA